MRQGHRRPPGRPGRDPVFVDRSGRRRRLVVAFGSAVAVALITGLGLLVAGFTGGVPVSVPGWPEAGYGPARPVRPAPATTGGSAAPDHAGVAPSPARRTTPAATGSRSASPGPTVSPPGSGSGNGQGTANRPTARPTRTPGKPG